MASNQGFFAGSTIQGAPPRRSLPQCGACKLFERCKTPKMPVSGAGARRILFVGEAPTKEDDDSGTHFSGKSGKYLRSVVRSLNFDLDSDGWSTNSIICRPAGGSPTSAQVEFCRPNIAKTIQTLKPTTIILMGVAAVAAVVGSIWKENVGRMETWAGWRIPCHAYNAWVCPTWSPVHVLREEDEVVARQFKEHLRWAVGRTACPWPTGVPNHATGVLKVHDPAIAAKWLRHCATLTKGAVAVDYETDRLKPDGGDSRIVSCSVAWGREEPEKCIAYPWHGEAIAATGELLKSPIPKIASNLKFEDRWTRKWFGHRVRGWVWDTMLAAHVLDNRPGITSVKFQAFVRLGVPVWNEKIEPFLKTKGNTTVNAILREIDINDLLLYNGLDSLLEFRVAMAQIKELGCKIPWEV